MRLSKLSIETSLYALALILAMGVRFLNLGVGALSEGEAGWAFQAWRLSQAPVVPSTIDTLDLSLVQERLSEPGSQPAYLFLTAGAFTLFGGSNFLARFWPALAGSLLVLSPLVASRRLRFVRAAPGIIMAFGLALDPGMVAASRTAGSSMMALGFGGLALALAAARSPILAGISLGLALWSDPEVLHGLVILGLAWLAYRMTAGGGSGFARRESGPETDGKLPPSRFAAHFGLGAGFTILVLGTFFSLNPEGLSLAVSAIPEYIGGWAAASEAPASRLLVALIVYQPLALLFGLVALGGAWINPEWDENERRAARFGGFVFLAAIVVNLIYPPRQVTDLIWISYPLWSLAALELRRHLLKSSDYWITSLSQAAFIFTLSVLLWLTLIGTLHAPADPQARYLRLGVMAGVAALGGLTTILVTYGWSWAEARRGLVWGVWMALGIYILANLWSASQVEGRGNRLAQHNLLGSWPKSGQAGLLSETVGDLSEWNTGRRDAIDVFVAVESPSVYWAFRDFPNAIALPQGEPIEAGATPAIVITRQEVQGPQLSALYRGQDFSWWVLPDWNGAAPADFIRWLAFRQAPVRSENLILWARGDLFPGGTLPPSGMTPEDDSLPGDDPIGGGVVPD